VTYPFDSCDDDFTQEGEIYERCAGCGLVFDLELEGIDDDDDPPQDEVSVLDPAIGPGGFAVTHSTRKRDL
jgi:hypothetical protein